MYRDYNPNDNPDLAAQKFLSHLFLDYEIPYPDGDVGVVRQVDRGFIRTPVAYPYVTIHSLGSDAPVVRLGQGSGAAARAFEIELLISIEYEDPDPVRGNERLTQIRWEAQRLLAQNARSFPGFEIAEFNRASFNIDADTGNYESWGYAGQVLIPLRLVLTYAGAVLSK